MEQIQFFLQEERNEVEVLTVLANILGFKVGSVDNDFPDAPGFVQSSVHAEGYRYGFLVSWPNTVIVSLKLADVAQNIADMLDAAVLTEIPDRDSLYLYSRKNVPISVVPVVYLDDGIAIKQAEEGDSVLSI